MLNWHILQEFFKFVKKKSGKIGLLQNLEYQMPLIVTFIDWEYCGVNFAAFDVANHFLEFTGVEEVLDYENNYPSLSYQLAWVSAYLSNYHAQLGREPPSNDECEKFLSLVNTFLPCSHLLWAIWALVQVAPW